VIPTTGGVIAEAEIASLNLGNGDASPRRHGDATEVVITYSDSELHEILSRYQRNGSLFHRVAIRSVDVSGKNARTLQSWEFFSVAVSATQTSSHEGLPMHTATLVFQSVSVQGTVVGLEDEPFQDADPRLFADHQVVETKRPELARNDEDATGVILVCRNEWNTLNSHPAGFHWFSA
jgi:hypothetical protein